MRAIPQSFLGRVKTLCRCWRILRSDGQFVAFTDHDVDLTINGRLHLSTQGLEGLSHETGLGFSAAGGAASGILMAPGLIEDDIIKGCYDGARVEVDLVDWTDVASYVRIETGLIGEITRSGLGFTTEIRSLATRLDEEKGRLFRPSCSANLGDHHCGVSLTDARYRVDSMITNVEGRQRISLPPVVNGHLFEAGSVIFMSGESSGDHIEITGVSDDETSFHIVLWRPPRGVVKAQDQVRIIAGCDKSFSSCRDRFSNTINFRGFPHMPGNDFVISVAADGSSVMDGRSLFK